MGKKNRKQKEVPSFDKKGKHGPSMWNGAFFTEQLREPNTPKIKQLTPPTSSSTPSGSNYRRGTKRGSSDSSPVSSPGSLYGDGKQPKTSPTSVSTSRMKPCLPGFRKAGSEFTTEQKNMPSEAVTLPFLQQPGWALKAPFEFAENNSVLKNIFKNVGYKEGTAALGKEGQGIKEPNQVGKLPKSGGWVSMQLTASLRHQIRRIEIRRGSRGRNRCYPQI